MAGKFSPIIPDCLECGQQMTLSKESGMIQGKSARYKQRRFVCSFCGYSETVSGGGYIDITENPVKIEKRPEEMPPHYKRQVGDVYHHPHIVEDKPFTLPYK